MSNTDKSPGDIFFENLAAITGNNALVKLDLGDKVEMEKHHQLVEKRSRKLEVFTSAVMIYFCNVLDSKDFAKGHKDRKQAIVGIADILTVAWVLYDSAKCLTQVNPPYSTIEQLIPWLDIKLAEVFSYGLDMTLCPAAETLKDILMDFDRISNVSKMK
ncbi:hypothetical protein [Aeromonas phage ZPAH34]|uniref:hypothetical protein n=1 Tax=Aeromonas phage ZPAH34 TaxID=2924888 RepID=UPI002329277A|nr:hypothetical protein PQD16_gp037 [Aeromonas phage ZPAH34]UOX39646.1 hypothetical protein [Aeromonas phage ZPAH34]